MTTPTLISLKDCWYRYRNQEKFVIKELYLELGEGRHYGLVGKNGSGKTTLVKIIAGLYSPSKGSITIHPDLRNVEGNIHVLFQNFGIYPITIRNFLELGNKKGLSEELLIESLRIVLMDEQIGSLPNQLDTPMSPTWDQGTKFSRGELQKLAIARAWLSDAKLIIFDEPTASLDVLSEKQIYEDTLPHFADRTLLVTSHRLGIIKNLDQIHVLDDGRIVESGIHEDLLNQQGVYKSLYENQRQLFTLDGIG
jgi:ATP-binding cassette subfamily B protein